MATRDTTERERKRISRDDGGFSLAARGNVNSIRCDESKFLKCPKEEKGRKDSIARKTFFKGARSLKLFRG